MQPFLFNLLLASGVQIHTSSAFITTPSSNLVTHQRRCQRIIISPRTQILHARDEDDKEDFVYAGRSRGRRDREEGGGYYDIDSPSSSYSSSSSSSRYQDNVEFFDLDDDDDELFDDDFDDDKLDEMTYNGIIPNPLLDAMGKLPRISENVHILCLLSILNHLHVNIQLQYRSRWCL